MEGGTRYLRELLERYNFDLVKALAAYNAGPQRVEQYGGVPPYYETKAYVARVVRDFNKKKLAAKTANTAAGSEEPSKQVNSHASAIKSHKSPQAQAKTSPSLANKQIPSGLTLQSHSFTFEVPFPLLVARVAARGFSLSWTKSASWPVRSCSSSWPLCSICSSATGRALTGASLGADLSQQIQLVPRSACYCSHLFCILAAGDPLEDLSAAGSAKSNLHADCCPLRSSASPAWHCWGERENSFAPI